jgi:phenylpyruvate tautomerase PptA (4-oxalocrotonate tautomerase family)
MPMLDAYIPKGALGPEAEDQLLAKLTDILIEWEGADPKNPRTRAASWVFLHHPDAVHVGGMPADGPRYRIIASVPEGQLDAERRAGMVAAVTQSIMDAEEEAGRGRDPYAVWVIAHQVPDGTWGAGGKIFGLADLAGQALRDREAGRAYAKQRLAVVKAERDAVFSSRGRPRQGAGRRAARAAAAAEA